MVVIKILWSSSWPQLQSVRNSCLGIAAAKELRQLEEEVARKQHGVKHLGSMTAHLPQSSSRPCVLICQLCLPAAQAEALQQTWTQPLCSTLQHHCVALSAVNAAGPAEALQQTRSLA